MNRNHFRVFLLTTMASAAALLGCSGNNEQAEAEDTAAVVKANMVYYAMPG